MRKSILAAALSLLVLPAATAFASEGTYQPQVVASPATGQAVHGAIGQSFIYNPGEGGQTIARPAVPANGASGGNAVAGGFAYNTGLNG
jgi:hypothetical protein